MVRNVESASPIEQIATRIRRRLYESEYSCLTAFLCDLSYELAAAEVGVVSVFNDSIRLRRSSQRESCFPAVESLINAAIRVKSSPGHVVDGVARYAWWGQNAKTIVLRRIWPSSAWRSASDETVWIYIVGAMIWPQQEGSPNEYEIQQVGGIASAFVRWKNELFSQRDDLVEPKDDDPRLLLQEFRKHVIRPVRPEHYHSLLQRFNPIFETDRLVSKQNDLPDRASQWAGVLDQLLSVCKRPVECWCWKTFIEPRTDGVLCPQTAEHNELLGVLTNLEKWRTGFWRFVCRARPFDKLRNECVDALRTASKLLLDVMASTSDEIAPLNFLAGKAGAASERILMRYFCSIAIQMAEDRLVDRWLAEDVHYSELEFPSRLAALASLLLGNGRWTESAITNLLRVVALFGHEVLDIPERVDLARHLDQTLRGESALYTLKSRYRDHFFHTLEVCFLGFLVLTSRSSANARKPFGEELLLRCTKHRKKKASKDFDPDELSPLPESQKELLAQWWTAALIHDTAYGIDIFDGTLKLLDFFGNRKTVRTFADEARMAVKNMASDLESIAPELKGDPSIRKGDHGVIAAASLAKILEAIGPKTAKTFIPAVRAIAFHNSRYPRIDACVDPIAALLVLCDTVQEWGRSSLGFDKSPAVLLSRIVEASSVPEAEQFGPVERYGITIAPKRSASGTANGPEFFHWSAPKKLRIELDYGERSLRDCAAKFTWADMTYNLQRVDFRPWDVELQVQVSVPLIAGNSNTDDNLAQLKTQLEYFGQFVEEQQVRFLSAWCRAARQNDPTGPIRSWIGSRDQIDGSWTELASNEIDTYVKSPPQNQTRAREMVTFNLAKLSEQFCDERPLMGGHAGNFHEAMKAWSVYLREQEDAPAVHRPPV